MKKVLLFLLVVGISILMVFTFSVAGCKAEGAQESTEVIGDSTAEVTEGETEVDTTPAEEVVEKKTTLVYGIVATPSGLDTDIQGDPQAWEMIEAVFDGIADNQYTKLELPDGRWMYTEDTTVGGQPWLSESYTLDEETRVITVKLKKGVISAWGNELTTKDIEWTLQRNNGTKGFGAYGYSVGGVDLSVDLGGFKIIDDNTYQLTQSSLVPLFTFELMMRNLWVCPFDSTKAKEYVTDDDPWASDWIGQHGGGFGPYYVTEWTADERVVLEANPNYWGGPPKQFTKIIYQVIPETANQIAALRDGTIDVAYDLSAREVSELKGEPGIRTIQQSTGSFLMVWANREMNEAFKDPKVMQAINCAIPREDIASLAYYGFAAPMTGPLPRAIGGGITDPEDWPFTYDLEKAKQLLSESSYPDGFDIVMTYNASSPTLETVSLLIQESLGKIGINVELKSNPSGAHDSQFRNRELEFVAYTSSTISSEPWFPLVQHYGVDTIYNYGNWFDPNFDDLVAKATTSTDKDEIIDTLDKVGKILLENPPVGYVVEIQDYISIRTEIDGWNWSLLKECKLDWLTWEE